MTDAMTFTELFALCIDILGWFTLAMLAVVMVCGVVKWIIEEVA